MFDLASASPESTDRPAPLSPARALLTPTWIASLALLVANDHWLKGAGLIPEVLTGKLSDFAGLVVAPVLLAAVLGIRSRRALLACHIAIGAVFAGIQLSPGFATSWSALMGAFGHPWLITCDPTDLIALPALALAWKLLVPEMDGELPSLTPLKRSAVAALGVFGLWSTVATSDVERADIGIDSDDTWYEDVYGHLYINNANDQDIALHVRPLRPELGIDCLQVALDPGRMLRPEAFGEAEHWLLPARTNIAIDLSSSPNCGAVWIAGEGIAPTILFVEQVAATAPQWWNGQSFDPEELGPQGLAIRFDEAGSEWVGGELLRFVPRQEAPTQPEGCEAPATESRLDWSPLSDALNQVVSVTPGIDGCFEIELLPASQSNDPVEETTPWYLCAPEPAVPFMPGEYLDIRATTNNSGQSELSVTLLDPDTLVAAVDEQNRLLRRARYLRGGSSLAQISPAIGRELVAVPNVSCPWQIEEGCANVERSAELAIVGAQSYLVPGEAVGFGDGGFVHTAVLSYARQRAVVDPTCSGGAMQLSYDVDIAVIDEPS